ncbi:MAG TPA: penicillin-binding transpeptidase domain-containing protein [Candidatus Acidoferrum sp.]|nr:penicillin-binding transpeptidase domain-containing protein [Candidatus Acidoferrum sp.]
MLVFEQLQKADKHLRVLSWVVVLGLLVLLSGLWWIQVVRSRHYVEDLRNQSYRTVRVPAPRGKILDRNGVALAENRPTYNISLYLEDRAWRDAVQQHYKRAEAEARKTATAPRKPKTIEKLLSRFGYKPALTQARRLTLAERGQLGRQARYNVTSNIVWQLGEALAQPMVLTNETKFHQHYDRRRALPLPIIADLKPEQIARFQEQGTRLPGVDMEVQPTRIYPHTNLAAQVVGYLTRTEDSAEDELSFYNYRLPDYRGLSGIEASLDEDLRGKAGAKSVLVNNLGYRQSETVLSPIEAGKNVTLTIDADIQRVAEKELAAAWGAHRPTRGAAVVLDVRTGEIIALASAPAFDPNDWIPFLPHTVWNSYTNEDIAPLQNRAVYGNYFPGSTFKIIVSLAGLEAGTINTNEIFKIESDYYVGRHRFNDTATPGEYNFRRAFIKSSNGYFIQQGLRVTPDRIVEMAQRFHFGEKTGIPLQESRGLLPTPQWVRQNRRAWSSVATGNLSIGQGDLDVTPLQLAVAMAAVANGGKVLAPQLIAHVRAPDQLIAPDQSSVRAVVRDELRVSRESMRTVREAMLADVEDPEGTAYQAFHQNKRPHVKEFRVGGKTGTAQVFKGEKFDHWTVWFTSWAMTDEPRYAVVVMVDHGASGGGTCAPIAVKIYQALEYREQRLRSPRKENFVRN